MYIKKKYSFFNRGDTLLHKKTMAYVDKTLVPALGQAQKHGWVIPVKQSVIRDLCYNYKHI